jgi:tRNA-dihydrouridine synthase B
MNKKNNNLNFWDKLKGISQKEKFFSALAPMAGISDSAFRQICKKCGVDLLYSEMASATALNYNPKKTLELIEFLEIERPYVVQLFGNDPKHFAVATKLISELDKKKRPDGIDINFGCPVQKVIKQGAGVALFKDLKRAKEVIKAVINNTGLPVSIKTRTKAGDVNILKFLDYMKGLDIKALMIHGRTFSQGFSGPIDAEIIKKSRNYFNGVLIANGGVGILSSGNNKNKDDILEYALELIKKTGADGIAVGQGALGNPFIFEDLKKKLSRKVAAPPRDMPQKMATPPRDMSQKMAAPPRDKPRKVAAPPRDKKKEIFKVALEHAKLAEKLKGEQGIIEMRKHLCWYVKNLPRASRMREKLIKIKTIKEIKNIFLENFKA